VLLPLWQIEGKAKSYSKQVEMHVLDRYTSRISAGNIFQLQAYFTTMAKNYTK